MGSYWTSEDIFLDGDLFFERLINDIDQARSSITVEMYIFNDDLLGKKIAAHLISASQRGVRVEMLVDGVGSYTFFDRFDEVFRKKGIEVRVYNPLPFFHPYYGELSFLQKLHVLGTRLVRMNKRNHRKIVTIDESILFTGSFNMTAEHTRYSLQKAWKDMGVRVTGENVKVAVLNFKRIWKLRDYYNYRNSIRHLKLNWKQLPLMLSHSLLTKRYFYKNFLGRINSSRTRVWLMTPYFIPKRKLIKSLGKAARRGVDVRLLISSKSDVQLFRTLQFFYYPFLLKKGVKVFQYTDTILHAKNYIIDDWVTIGSTNLNHRSLMHDLEADMILQDLSNIKAVQENFLASVGALKAVDLEELNRRPVWDRFLSRLFFTFRYWF